MTKMNGLLLFVSLLSMFSCSDSETTANPSATEQTYQLVNPNATAETKKLFNVLTELYGKKIISGVVASLSLSICSLKSNTTMMIITSAMVKK